MITITKADLTRADHSEAVVSLLNEYACDPMGGGEPLSPNVKQTLIAEMAKRTYVHSFIAFDGESPIGLINLIEGFSTFTAKPLLNVHDVMVSRSYRGQGISRKLFQAADALARELGCIKLTLEVLEGNEAAKKAYSSLGFKPYQLDPRAGVAQFWHKKISRNG